MVSKGVVFGIGHGYHSRRNKAADCVSSKRNIDVLCNAVPRTGITIRGDAK